MIYLLQIHKEYQHKIGEERERERERERTRKRMKHD